MIIGEHERALIRTFNHITKAICCSWRVQDIINTILESHVCNVEPKSHNIEFQALFVVWLLLLLMPFVSSVVFLNKKYLPENLSNWKMVFGWRHPIVCIEILVLYYSDIRLLPRVISLVQNVPPAILLRFLREHRSEWADNNMDAYTAAAIKVGPCSLSGSRVGNYGGQVILPLAHTIEHEEVIHSY